MTSQSPLRLDKLTTTAIKDYFDNTWTLYEWLFSSIKADETYYTSPDPLRNPLIFYVGHTASFYINKLKLAGVLTEGIHPDFEELFAKGVDPAVAQELDVHDCWPSMDAVRVYRKQVYDKVHEVVDCSDFNQVITATHPLWNLFMAIEHDRIHFETSSMLIRQLNVDLVQRPEGWKYAPSFDLFVDNELLSVEGGVVKIGKSKEEATYGWDNEYGYLEEEVEPFTATQNLISNAEYLDFVTTNAYNDSQYWTEEGWAWKEANDVKYPKFWIANNGGFSYRAMFDEITMPMDWPVEVNAHEAWAYCRWRGEEWRLLSEAEFALISSNTLAQNNDPAFECGTYNLNFKYGSPTPVGFMKSGQSALGFNDVFGNVWDWLSDDFYALPDFESHPHYDDFSAPYFDNKHSMLLGGSWATIGMAASKYYRLWFRRHFYQHAGFRLAKSL